MRRTLLPVGLSSGVAIPVARGFSLPLVRAEGTDAAGAFMRVAHPHRPRHGAIGVAPAVAVQPIAARAIIAVGTVAIAPGRVLGLADAQVQRAVFAQRHGDGGGEVAIAAGADPGADLAAHLAGRGLFPGVGPLLDRRRTRLALADPA